MRDVGEVLAADLSEAAADIPASGAIADHRVDGAVGAGEGVDRISVRNRQPGEAGRVVAVDVRVVVVAATDVESGAAAGDGIDIAVRHKVPCRRDAGIRIELREMGAEESADALEAAAHPHHVVDPRQALDRAIGAGIPGAVEDSSGRIAGCEVGAGLAIEEGEAAADVEHAALEQQGVDAAVGIGQEAGIDRAILQQMREVAHRHAADVREIAAKVPPGAAIGDAGIDRSIGGRKRIQRLIGGRREAGDALLAEPSVRLATQGEVEVGSHQREAVRRAADLHVPTGSMPGDEVNAREALSARCPCGVEIAHAPQRLGPPRSSDHQMGDRAIEIPVPRQELAEAPSGGDIDRRRVVARVAANAREVAADIERVLVQG